LCSRSSTTTAVKRHVPTSVFLDNVAGGKVTKVEQEGSTLTVTPNPIGGPVYTVTVPASWPIRSSTDMRVAAADGKVPLPQFGAKPRRTTAGSAS
jgi:hypothetical protein